MEKTLKIKAFHITNVQFGDKLFLEDNILCLKKTFKSPFDEIEKITINILQPNNHHVETNTVMDIIPISTKVLGTLGEGITHTLTGVFFLMTGAIINGEQMHEFGSSEGILADHLSLNNVGTPSTQDYIIHIDLLAKENITFNRDICLKMFETVDLYIQEIRELLKLLNGKNATEVHEFVEKQNIGKPKVALVKQVAGQGAMYDTLLFPNEPSGFVGGNSIIDMNNMPIFISPNEYRDGAIRAMV